MQLREPLPLYHSWPLFDMQRQFDLGRLIDPAAMPRFLPDDAYRWSCDLDDNSLYWSQEVFDLFGFPRGTAPSRQDALGVYCEESRAAMESLRSYAIRHRRGFTIDLTIHPGGGALKSFRLMAVPHCEDGRVTRLHGLKIPLPQ